MRPPSGRMTPTGCRPTVRFVMPPFEPYGPTSGAIATVTRGLARELTRRGTIVEIITPQSGTYYHEGVVMPQSGGRVLTAAMTHIAARLQSFFPDFAKAYSPYLISILPRLLSSPRTCNIVIHNDFLMPRALARLLPEARVTLWLHNTIDSPDGDAVLHDHRELFQLVAVSESLRQWFVNRYNLDPQRIGVVRNGVDLDAFRPDWHRETGEGGVTRLICHGRLDEHKGFHLVAQAVRDLRLEGLNLHLTIAGPKNIWNDSAGAADAYAFKLMRLLDDGAGTYLGRVAPDQIPEVLKRHHISCSISTDWEGFSLAALEAMACGCATVVSDRGGLVELVGEAGTIVAPELAAVRDAIRSLASNQSKLEIARRSARRRAQEFSWCAAANQFLALRPDLLAWHP